MSGELFSALVGRAEEGGIVIEGGARWIKRSSEFDADMMAKGDCHNLVLSRQQRAMFIDFQGRRFFLITGFSDCEVAPPGLTKVDPSPAMLILAFHELRIELTATSAETRDVLENQYAGKDAYDGHELNVIISLFPKFFCFEVDSSYSSSSTIERLTGSYACRSYNLGPLMLDAETKDSLRSLFEDESDHIPFPLILQGVLAFAWQTLFLELYRCLEQLYPAPRLSELASELLSSRSLFDLADIIETTLTWRPKEDESLIKILRYCSRVPVDEALQAFEREPSIEYDQAVEVAGRAIYQLRNSLVHFRASRKSMVLSDVNWNILIRAMSSFISQSYSEVGDRFYKAVEEKVVAA